MIVGLLILALSSLQAGDKNKSKATKTSYFSKTMRTCAIMVGALGSQFTLVSTPQAKEGSSDPVAIVVGKNTAPTFNDGFYYSKNSATNDLQSTDFEI